MKRKKTITEGMDAGSPQMARHFTIVPKLSSPTTTSMKVLDGSEIDELLLKDVINPAEHGTLNSLASKLLACGFSALRSPDYSSPIFSDPSIVSDKKAQALRGAVHLIDKMDKHEKIGPHRRKKLINLVLQDVPWTGDKEELKACVFALDDVF